MAVLRKGSCQCRPVALPPSGIGGKNTWEKITMYPTSLVVGAKYIWTDGKNIYNFRMYGTDCQILNDNTWEPHTWKSDTDLRGDFIWSDGTNIYSSHYTEIGLDKNEHLVLNGDTWISKKWKLQSSRDYMPNGYDIWSDGTNIYYSESYRHLVLDGDTWKDKEWNVEFHGAAVWSDGVEIYMYTDSDSDTAGNYQLIDGVWKRKEWNIDIAAGANVWTDGENMYYSGGKQQYVLRDGNWYPQTWNGYPDFYGNEVWSDGMRWYISHTFYGQGNVNYVLTDFTPPTPSRSPSAMMLGYQVGQAVRGMRK